MSVSRAVLDGDRSVSEAVVEAVAEAKDVSPMDVQPPLHYSVDADALDDLFRTRSAPPTGDPRVSFTYAGCEVTVRGGEAVVVRELDGGPERVE